MWDVPGESAHFLKSDVIVKNFNLIESREVAGTASVGRVIASIYDTSRRKSTGS